MQIRKKLPIVLNILICVPMVILTLITYLYSANYALNQSKSTIKELAISEGRALEALIQTTKYEVQIIANDKRVKSYVQIKENERLKKSAQIYIKECAGDSKLFILDNKGEVILASTDEPLDIKLIDSVDFKEVLQGKINLNHLYNTSKKLGKCINITVPIEKDDKVIGAICKLIDSALVSEFSESIHIGETGTVYILDDELRILAHPEEVREGSILNSPILSEEITKTIAQGEKSGACTCKVTGKARYVAYYILEDLGWTLCVVQEVSEIQKQAFWGCILIIFTIIVLIILINIVSRKVIREIIGPIDLLVETMNGVAAGDLESFCKYEGNDEFGMLSQHYNKMLKKLGESHKNLSEVCKELAVTKQALENNYHDLEKSKEALVISEERYRTALDAIDEVIWEYHVDSGQFFATENWSRIIGEELREESVCETIERFLEPTLVKNMVVSTRRCLSGEIRDFTQEVWIMKEGKKCWLLCKGHAIVGEDGQVEKMIGILTDITDNKTNEERVRRLTFFDGLTGCLNKSTFIESVDALLEAEAEDKKSAVLFIDLDDFKKINDVLSHETGDQVLNYIGKVLTELLPPDAFIGRFGGDEFVIFKSDIEDMEEVHQLIYGILSIFQQKLEIESLRVHLTCSIGIAMYPEDGKDSAMLLKNADTAMYKVKENGKNSYSFYTKAMSQTLDRKLLVEEALREAVGKNSFYLQYQPIVDLQSGRTVGCEALIRLYDSELGFISPGEFIPIAEETDLIIEAGDWVLENALKTLSYLHASGNDQFTMNINVSSIQIREEDFLDKLVQVIKRTGVLPQSIKLEVTESVLMEDIEKSIELFNHVKAMGIKIALDDFGTGYSSLNYLRSIPLDVLKIDKSFVDEITTSKVLSEIVDSIINMAHALNIAVVAEGVENEMQLEVLKKKGCDFIQGYYFSKPLSEKEFEARLKKENHIN